MNRNGSRPLMDRAELEELQGFYHDHLYHDILRYWLERGIDHEYGGYFTCFDNTGTVLTSTDKYVWSQGRMVWVFSKLADQGDGEDDFLPLARMGATFLMRHCRLATGECAFVLTREGKPKEVEPGAGYAPSTFADCFAVLGLGKYAAVSGEEQPLETALAIYDSIIKRAADGEFKTHPEPTPAGFKAHSMPMILLNISHELAGALERFGHERRQEVEGYCVRFAEEIMANFVREDNIIRETISRSPRLARSLIGRYVNPGHSLEDMWFILHHLLRRGGEHDLVERAIAVIERSCELGWDPEFGGIMHFVDMEGGKPRGELAGLEQHPLVVKVCGDWDTKLWWVHAEALYAALLGHRLSKRHSLWDWFVRIHDYTFRTFPHPDRSVGEWIQIRDRRGSPLDKVVALPVKDPFHISRSLIHVSALLAEMRVEEENKDQTINRQQIADGH